MPFGTPDGRQVLAIGIILAVAHGAWARPVDFSQRSRIERARRIQAERIERPEEKTVPDGEVRDVVMAPVQGDRVPGFGTPVPTPFGEAREPEMVPAPRVRTQASHELQESEIHRENGRLLVGAQYGEPVPQFQNIPFQRQIDDVTRHMNEDFVTGRDAPRLQDINRYVFRKNGARPSGELPVSVAAGGADGEGGS